MIRALALTLSVVVLGAACEPRPGRARGIPEGWVNTAAPIPRSEPRVETQRILDPDGNLLRVVERRVDASGRSEKHGREAEWYGPGRLRFDRFWQDGEPAGTWRSWFPDGTKQSHVHCDEEPGLTSWWHENGRLASRGWSRSALKDGDWVHYHPNGAVAERGAYRRGARVGEWEIFRADGSRSGRGEYRADVRVGEWESWDENGTRTVRRARP